MKFRDDTDQPMPCIDCGKEVGDDCDCTGGCGRSLLIGPTVPHNEAGLWQPASDDLPMKDQDADFIAAARTDVPRLLDEVARLESALSFARGLLDSFNEDFATLPDAVRELKRLRRILSPAAPPAEKT